MMQSTMPDRPPIIGTTRKYLSIPPLVDPSFYEAYASDVLLCAFMSAKPFLDGAILQVRANGVFRAFRIRSDLKRRIKSLGLAPSDYLRLGIIRIQTGEEFVVSLDRLRIDPLLEDNGSNSKLGDPVSESQLCDRAGPPAIGRDASLPIGLASSYEPELLSG